ncbi:hypothetical protein DFH28DRAFT_1079443 [Melampsora americana]|nr:hypothetical protein DFH28DRAFT_1079443 [Melampsora americana]
MKNIIYSFFVNVFILKVCVAFSQDSAPSWRLAQASFKRNIVHLEKPIGDSSVLTHSQKVHKILRKRGFAASDLDKLTATNEVTKTATTSSEKSHELKPVKTAKAGHDEIHEYQGVQPSELSNEGVPLIPSERNKVAPKDSTSRPPILKKYKIWIQTPLTDWFHKVWQWIKQFFKSADHEPLRIYHVSALEESPFKKPDIPENSEQKSLEMLIQRLSSLTSVEDPEGVAKAQLKHLQDEHILDKIPPATLTSAFILPSIKHMSLFDSPIPLREAEWQLLEHVFTYSSDPSIREFLYHQYQMDDEFRRGVCFASSTHHLRELQQLQSFPVNSLTREILEIFRVSNWGAKDVDEVRISAAEDLFLEFIKEKGLDPLAVRSLLRIPEILENVSQKSLDKEFISIVAIASNELWPGVLSERLPNSSWIYRLLRDHECAHSFDEMIKSEHAGVSMWPNSPSEELKERKGATERKKLIELFQRLISPRSPDLLELQTLADAFLDSPSGKHWIEEGKVNSLTDNCLALLFSDKFDISTRGWIYSALEHLKSYGFPRVVNRINTAFDLHKDILTDITCFWYMDSHILVSGNDDDSARVRWFAGLLQKLTTRTKWTDILSENLTFKKTMDYLLEELKDDSLSIAKGRMQLYEMLIFVLNHFELARDHSLIKTIRDDPLLLKCLGALSVLSGTDIELDLEIPRQATGFGFGLNKVSSITNFNPSNLNWIAAPQDLSIDEPYLKFLASRGQIHDTGIIHNGHAEKVHRQELIDIIERYGGSNELRVKILDNLANLLSELRHIRSWDKNDVDPVNSHSLTEAMLYYFENVAVSQSDKMLLSKILEFLFENNPGLQKEASSYINSGLQHELDFFNYLNTFAKYSAEGTNTDIWRINSEIVELSSEVGKGKIQKIQKQFRSILEAIVVEIGMNDWVANEQKVVSSMLSYFQMVLDSLNVDPFLIRMDKYHRESLDPAHRELFKQLQGDVHGIISSKSVHPDEQSNLIYCVKRLRGIKTSWTPRSDYDSEDSIYHLMVYVLTEVRKDNATFGAITAYKLILSYIQEISEAEEIIEMMNNAMTVDRNLRNKLSAAQALLNIKQIRHDRTTLLYFDTLIGNILATNPETWDNVGEIGETQAQTWAKSLAQVLKKNLQKVEHPYDTFKLVEELAKLSRQFCWKFVKEAGEDEVLAKEIGIYVGNAYKTLRKDTFPSGSVPFLLLEATNLHKAFSKIPTRLTETSSSKWTDLFNSCLSLLKQLQN